MKILMVCLGNICRSPLADGLLRRKVSENQLNVEVDSAGTSNLHRGEAPDLRMQATAKKNGTDLSFLRARQFVKSDFHDFDLIYVMDKSNLKNVLALASSDQDRQKVKLILNELNPSANDEVPDPYFGGQSGFDQVYALLDEATDKIINNIKQKAN